MKDRIGQLKQVIKFQVAMYGRDTTGGQIENWIESTEIFAKAEPQLSSNENIEGPGIAAKGMCIFTVRYLKAIDERMKIVHEDNVYEILSVLPDNYKMYSRIEARKMDTAKPLYFVDGQGNIWRDGVSAGGLNLVDGSGQTLVDGQGNPWVDGLGRAWIAKEAYTAPSITGLSFFDANSTEWVMNG